MKKEQVKPVTNVLRQRAEKILKKSGDISDESENLKLIQELSVYQLQLEMQNEELIAVRQAEKAITDKYKQLYDFAPSGYLTLDKFGKITELNLFASKMLGRERAKLIKASFEFFLKPESRSLFRSFLSDILLNSYSQACEVVFESGFHIHLTGRSETGQVLLIAVDITHLKKVEEENTKLLDELREAGKKIDLALVNARIGSWEWDIRKGEIKIDGSLAEIFGLSREKRSFEFSDFEKFLLNEDIPKIRTDFREALRKRIPFESIFRVKEDGEKLKYLSAKAFINYDSENPVGLTGLCIDITKIQESSQRALIELATELSKSNKELQNFAYIASHDLQEPLRMVTSFVQLLEKQYSNSLDDRAHEYINFAVQGSKRMYELLNSLLAYSRIRTKQKAIGPVDMNDILEKVTDNLQMKINELDARIQIRRLPVIYADGSQMLQLMQNLIDNSIKFSKKPAEIIISSRLINNDNIFSVKDKGIGIEPEYFEKIFRIFQRLHSLEEYSGTGVGLAICKSIVERHGGNIWLESVPGKGTTFFFSIPVKPREPDE